MGCDARAAIALIGRIVPGELSGEEMYCGKMSRENSPIVRGFRGKFSGWGNVSEGIVRGECPYPVSPMQDYKSPHAAVMICATRVNTQTHTRTETQRGRERERERGGEMGGERMRETF